jgi:antitoxin CptB
MNLTDLEITRKRLLWRATHRGIKEMDILVGGYARLNLAKMGQAELTQFADLLEIPDQDLLSWATKQSTVPLEQQSAMLEDMLGFLPEGNL